MPPPACFSVRGTEMAALTTSAQPTDAQSGCAALSKDLLLATVMVTSADRTFGTCLVTKNQKIIFKIRKKNPDLAVNVPT